jgi:hypothetical protein
MSMEEAMTSVRAMARNVGLQLLARPELRKQMIRARNGAVELDSRTRAVVKERPIAALGTALLTGYAIARLRARRRKGNGAWNTRSWWTS